MISRLLAAISKALIGAYSAFRSGHAVNNLLLRELFADESSYEIVSFDDANHAPAGFRTIPTFAF